MSDNISFLVIKRKEIRAGRQHAGQLLEISDMTVNALPDGFRLVRRVDMAHEKRLSLLINLLAVVIAAVMVGLGLILHPITGLLDINMLLHAFYVFLGVIVYIVLHELIHALFMRIFGGKTKIKLGMTLIYPYAGAPETYFGRVHYAIIAFAPVVIIGIALLIANIALPTYFWYIYFVQIVNISGAAGDFYIIGVAFASMPNDVLINDTGVSMTLYSAKTTKNKKGAR